MDRSLPDIRDWPRWWLIVGGAAVLLIALLLAMPQRAQQPFGFVHRAHIIAFYEKGWDDNFGLPDLRKHVDDLDTLTPFWYTIRRDGTIKTQNFEPEVMKLAKDHHKKLVPLVTNAGGNFAILQNQAAMDAAINNIVALVKKNDLDGVNVDFELIPASVRDNMSHFMKTLRDRLPKGKTLGVSVFPVVKIDPSVSGAYDYSALGAVVDQFVIMLYNRHQDNSAPGPNAPLDWVRKNVEYAMTKVKSSKIFLGVPGYGWDWKDGTHQAKYRSSEKLGKIANDKGVPIKWDDQSQTPFFTYDSPEGGRIAWYESPQSAKLKMQLVNQHHLGGIALWRMGFEPDAFWTEMKKELK